MLASPHKALAGAILLVSTTFAALTHAQSSRLCLILLALPRGLEPLFSP